MAEDAEDDIDAEDDAEGGEGEDAKKGGLKKLLLFIGLPAVIVVLGGVAAALLLLGGGEDGEAVAEGEDGAAAEVSAADRIIEDLESYHTLAVGDFQVDIEGDDGRPLTMQLKFSVAYEDEDVGRVLQNEAMQARLRSVYLEFLRTLRPDDLYGSMGTFRLRAELLRRTNLEIQPLSAEAVLIDDLIIV
jgi:flagellar FliL protein